MKTWHKRVIITVVAVAVLAAALLTIHVIVNNVNIADVFKSLHGR
jgi:hypothetical protein